MTFDYYELDEGPLEIEGYDNEDKAKIVEIPDTIDEKKVSVCDYDWVLEIRRQCIEANVGFWFKQTGSSGRGLCESNRI